MSGLSLTPPTRLRMRLQQMAWEQLQDAGRQKDGSRWVGKGKDASREEVPSLPSFLNIISCYPELTEAKEIMKRQARKNWRTMFSEADLLGPAPEDCRHIGQLHPEPQAIQSGVFHLSITLNGPQKGLFVGPCTCGDAVTVLATMVPRGLGHCPPKQLSSS